MGPPVHYNNIGTYQACRDVNNIDALLDLITWDSLEGGSFQGLWFPTGIPFAFPPWF